MAEIHGIYTKEVPFAPLTEPAAAVTIPFVVGTAPINLSTLATAPVNTPIYARNWNEAKAALGYSDDWESYTLCEVMYSHFMLYGQGPIVFVNVLDPDTNSTAVAPASRTLVRGLTTLPDAGIITSTISVQSANGSTTYTRGTDFNTTVDDNGKVVVSRISTGTIGATDTLLIGYSKLDASTVDNIDIIGGTDQATGKSTGLELIKEVMPRFQVVPTLILAPGYSEDPIVGAVMKAKTALINSHFTAIALTDIPATVTRAQLEDWKEENNYNGVNQIVTWGKARYNDRTYHMSTVAAGVICATDSQYDGTPYNSPSNKTAYIDALVSEDGTEIALGIDEARTIEGYGIFTAVNFVGGWRAWGNRTAGYPEINDPQNAYIPIRRMFNWIENNLVTRYWIRIDSPLNKRLRETVVDDANIWFNGLVSNEYILGGRAEFLSADNPPASLAEGKLNFRVYVTPPSPAKEITFIVAYDAAYLSTIVG